MLWDRQIGMQPKIYSTTPSSNRTPESCDLTYILESLGEEILCRNLRRVACQPMNHISTVSTAWCPVLGRLPLPPALTECQRLQPTAFNHDGNGNTEGLPLTQS
ncbi:hypothetical protein J6590_023670 [Homalodisca vitripennis]|nr:hypothetical protein J6590_023670 [Homalodisca vitripennis]